MTKNQRFMPSWACCTTWFIIRSFLEAGRIGEPFWMPEIGLGIGRCQLPDDPLEREVLSWYDTSGDRCLSKVVCV